VTVIICNTYHKGYLLKEKQEGKRLLPMNWLLYGGGCHNILPATIKISHSYILACRELTTRKTAATVNDKKKQ